MTPTATTTATKRFFSSFYDVVSSLRPSIPIPISRPPTIPRQFSTPARAHTRPASTPNGSYYYNLLGATGATSTQWGPKSRYVVTRSFAGFCAWTTVPGSTTTAVVHQTRPGVKDAMSGAETPWKRLRGLGVRVGVATRGLHTRRDPAGAGREKVGNVVRTGKVLGQVRLRRRSASTGGGGRGRRTAGGVNGNGKVVKEKVPAEEKEKVVEKVVEVEKIPPAPKTPQEHRMLDRISNIHRPTKDEMLAAATGMWQRLRIRTKWSLIRQMRPYNWEDISAFLSWLVVGHVVWIVVGTTTFVGVLVALVNSVVAQGKNSRETANVLC